MTEKRINQKYKCLVIWYDGSVIESDAVAILSREAFEITRQPEDIAVAVGENAVFEIEARRDSMSRWHKQYLAVAISAAMILEGPVMTVSATSSDLLPQEEVIEEAVDDMAEDDVGPYNCVIPEGVEEIEWYAYYNNQDIISLKLPQSLRTIGVGAFYRCFSLEEIDFGGVQEIQDYAFELCYDLREINLPDTTEIVAQYVFDRCYNVSKIRLPDSLRVLDAYAFAVDGDYYIPSGEIRLPSNSEVLGCYAFAGRHFESVIVPSNALQNADFGVLACTYIDKLVFEDGTTGIPDDLFYVHIGVEQNYVKDTLVENIYVPREVTSMANIPEGTIIHGEAGSYAIEYAKENNLRYFNNELTLGVGLSDEVVAGGVPEDRYVFTSDNEQVATVDENGVVHGVSEGTCNITVNYIDNREMGSCVVTVEDIKPEILKQPVSVEAKIGDTVKFSIQGKDIDNYQWYYSKDGGETWNLSTMKGYNTDTITLYVTDHRLGQMYKCQVTGAQGAAIDSDAVIILPKDKITRQPEDIAAAVGENAVFKVEAAGALKYQWYYSLDGGTTWSKSTMTGNRTNKLTVPVTEKRIGQRYKCLVTWGDGYEYESDMAAILSKAAFEITRQPVNIAASVGDNAVFNIEAIGATKYQWYFSQNGGETWSKSTMTGSKTNKLIVPVIEKRFGQMYRCQITGKDGRILTSDAALIIRVSDN